MELERGQIVDRYTVQRELGRGGMAVVYLVEHNTLETLHALKVLTVGSHKIRDRLIQEGKVQAQLRHPNVVAVTDVLDVQGSPGLLMEYVDGPALDAWLLGKRLEIEEAEALFLGILDGVERAHQLGIVHRDLKPANVMLSRGPRGWIPKVTDFGLAKALQEEGDMQRTRTGMPMGTPSYMSPEQIRDAKGVDRRTDVFALGCILYELTCGQRAFFGRDMLEIFNAVASGRHTASTTLVPDMPSRVEQAINGSLVVDRERRIPDCATLREVLLGERSFLVSPPSSPDATYDLFGEGAGATAAQSEFVAAARASLAHSLPSRPPPGGTFGLDDLEETPAGPTPTATLEPMPSAFPGPGLAPHDAPAHTSPPQTPTLPPPGSDASIPPAPAARPVLPWVIAALAVGAALTFGGVTLLDGEQPARSPAPPRAAVESAPSAPAEPVVAEPVPAEPVGPTPSEPPIAEPAPPDSTPVTAPEPAAPPTVEPAPSATTAPPAIAAPAVAAPTTAHVSFHGADSIQLEEVDFRRLFPAGELPPGRYRVLAVFDGAAPVPAGEITLAAGQRVTLDCDPDFRRCRPH